MPNAISTEHVSLFLFATLRLLLLLLFAPAVNEFFISLVPPSVRLVFPLSPSDDVIARDSTSIIFVSLQARDHLCQNRRVQRDQW